MAEEKNLPELIAATRAAWRKWLAKNGPSEKNVLLIIYHKKTNIPCVHYEAAVEEALCFGWIDRKATKRDEESYFLWFTPRSPKGNWSKVNKERAQRMIDEGLMTPAGQAFIDLAKQTGTWDAFDDDQGAVIPEDLQKLFNKNKKALKNFEAFPPSSKRLILEWIMTAKRPETREKRITETVELAAENKRAHHPQ